MARKEDDPTRGPEPLRPRSEEFGSGAFITAWVSRINSRFPDDECIRINQLGIEGGPVSLSWVEPPSADLVAPALYDTFPDAPYRAIASTRTGWARPVDDRIDFAGNGLLGELGRGWVEAPPARPAAPLTPAASVFGLPDVAFAMAGSGLLPTLFRFAVPGWVDAAEEVANGGTGMLTQQQRTLLLAPITRLMRRFRYSAVDPTAWATPPVDAPALWGYMPARSILSGVINSVLDSPLAETAGLQGIRGGGTFVFPPAWRWAQLPIIGEVDVPGNRGGFPFLVREREGAFSETTRGGFPSIVVPYRLPEDVREELVDAAGSLRRAVRGANIAVGAAAVAGIALFAVPFVGPLLGGAVTSVALAGGSRTRPLKEAAEFIEVAAVTPEGGDPPDLRASVNALLGALQALEKAGVLGQAPREYFDTRAEYQEALVTVQDAIRPASGNNAPVMFLGEEFKRQERLMGGAYVLRDGVRPRDALQGMIASIGGPRATVDPIDTAIESVRHQFCEAFRAALVLDAVSEAVMLAWECDDLSPTLVRILEMDGTTGRLASRLLQDTLGDLLTPEASATLASLPGFRQPLRYIIRQLFTDVFLLKLAEDGYTDRCVLLAIPWMNSAAKVSAIDELFGRVAGTVGFAGVSYPIRASLAALPDIANVLTPLAGPAPPRGLLGPVLDAITDLSRNPRNVRIREELGQAIASAGPHLRLWIQSAEGAPSAGFREVFGGRYSLGPDESTPLPDDDELDFDVSFDYEWELPIPGYP